MITVYGVKYKVEDRWKWHQRREVFLTCGGAERLAAELRADGLAEATIITENELHGVSRFTDGSLMEDAFVCGESQGGERE